MYINANLIHCRSNTQESYIDAYTETLSYLKHIILNLASIQPRFKQCTEEGINISYRIFKQRGNVLLRESRSHIIAVRIFVMKKRQKQNGDRTSIAKQ